MAKEYGLANPARCGAVPAYTGVGKLFLQRHGLLASRRCRAVCLILSSSIQQRCMHACHPAWPSTSQRLLTNIGPLLLMMSLSSRIGRENTYTKPKGGGGEWKSLWRWRGGWLAGWLAREKNSNWRPRSVFTFRWF